MEQLGEPPDLRQRRAQFVRDAGDELGAEPRQLLLPVQLHDGDAEESGRQDEHPSEQGKARPRQSADDELGGKLRPQSDMHHESAKIRLERIGRAVRRLKASRRSIDLAAIERRHRNGEDRVGRRVAQQRWR